MNPAKSAAQRKADERQRQRDAGLVAVTVWIHPVDRAKLAHYIKRLNERAGTQWLAARIDKAKVK